jgi:hypothetical protein
VQIAVGLDAVTNQWIDDCEGFLNLAEMVQQRRLAVDEQRRTVQIGKLTDGYVLAVKYSIVVVKMVHESDLLSNSSKEMTNLTDQANR